MQREAMIGPGRMSRGDTTPGGRRDAVHVSRRSLLARLWRYMGRYRALLLLGLVLVVLANSIALAGPKLSGLAIDVIVQTKDAINYPALYGYAGWMAAFYALSSLLNYLLSRVMLRLRQHVVRQMRDDVFSRLVSLPVSYFDSRQTGDILSVISYDIDTVNESLSSDLIQILQSAITVVVSLLMMLSISPLLVSIFAITVPLSIVFTRWFTGKARPLFRQRSEQLGALNGFMEQMMDGQKTTRAYGREQQVLERFDHYNGQAVKSYTKAEFFGTIVMASVNFINNISLALVSVFGALVYLRGYATAGDISSFVQYSRKFSGPINETATIIGDLQSAFAAAERVFRLIDELPEAPDPADARILTQVYGDVQVQHVRFGYQKEKPIIADFSMHAAAGQLVAIVGPTGAGKTTIINLLMRFYDIDDGAILLDGQDIYRLQRDSLRRAYTMVLQDTWLFSGTIYENIAYARPDATADQVHAAAQAAMAHSFIVKLPQQYDTPVGDAGANLSKGQRQMIAIARAMLMDSPMLILDEATSNVDTRTEQQIQAAMRRLMQGRTAFVIAHRLSTIRNADHILVVEGGNTVEQGTHDALMRSRGAYYRLYHAQFESE